MAAYGDSLVKGGRGVDLAEILHMIFFFLLCPNFPHYFARIWEGSCPPPPAPCLVRPCVCRCRGISRCNLYVDVCSASMRNSFISRSMSVVQADTSTKTANA